MPDHSPEFEYKVVPAPKKGVRAKGAKGPEGKFANALMVAMNGQAAEGWTYLRAETLPCEERSGMVGKTTTFQSVLVFQRPVSEGAPVIEDVVEEEVEAEPEPVIEATPEPAPEIPEPLVIAEADAAEVSTESERSV